MVRKKLALIGLMALFTNQTMFGMGPLQPILTSFSSLSTTITQGFESLKTYIQNNTSMIPFTIASSIVGAGLFYCLSRVHFKQKQALKLELIKSPQQIPVLIEKNNAHSGYHALKNALLFLNQNEHESNIITDKHFQEKLKIWQKHIEIFRKKTVLNQYLNTRFLDMINIENKNIKDQFVLTLSNAFKVISSQTIDNLPTIITLNTISSVLKINLETLKKYLPAFEFFSLSVNDLFLSELLTKAGFDLICGLSAHEINELIKYETNNIQNSLTIINRIEDKNASIDEVFRTIAQKFAQPSNTRHCFIIGTTNESNPKNRGPWFTLLIQKKDNCYKVFVTDSLGIDRTNDIRVKNVIQKLNQKLEQLMITSSSIL